MLWKHVNGDASLTVAEVVAVVSQQLYLYSGNLTVDGRAMPGSKKGNACRFVLRVKDSGSPPARKAASGRRTTSANWEAHKVVMEELFRRFPDSILVSALTTYTGRSDFERRHADTWSKNGRQSDQAGSVREFVKCLP